jgi:hypothetical protein
LGCFDGELEGEYLSLENVGKINMQKHMKDEFLLEESSGLTKDWPSGRGVFHNQNRTLLVLVNDED